MKSVYLKICFIILLTIPLIYASVWRDRDIYSSEANLQVGDIVVVTINDLSKFSFDAKLNNSSASDILSNPDVTVTGFLPKISASKNFKNNESSAYRGSSKIVLSIATRVTERQANGFAVITGTRTYSFGGVTNTMAVRGIIDPRMINGGVIDSENVADFIIQITGRKEGIAIRKGPLAEGEAASIILTEQEKQAIITDYLEKMIRELTR
ncbi:MAG TPA: flagellar basal body L-ring protein FlgH [Spirochaetota bacterium]|nr:flagellar basal body L-ring protein FlgH [Spirochaetota bacterium]